MQFLTVPVGNTELAFISDSSITVPFSFPQPVTRVSCMLQGLDLEYPDDDHHVKSVHLEPQIQFDDRVSTTNGTLRVHFIWRDDADSIGDGRIAVFYARFVLVGE
ncbi:MAG: hypothetical protein ABI639_08895 [Thermoanaerobaculia bacterium]